MSAPEDRPDSETDEAREFLADADEGMIVEPRTVRFARGWVAAVDRLAAVERERAAEARLEAVREIPLQPDSTPEGVRQNSYSRGWTDAINDVRAALSVAPQPQPDADNTRVPVTEYQRQPQPAKCKHGQAAKHFIPRGTVGAWGEWCPGPVSAAAPEQL